MHSRDPLPRPKNFVPSLPQSVENILLKMLAKDPQNRYQSMGEVETAFRQSINDYATPIASSRNTAQVGRMRPLRAHVPWIMAGVFVLALLAFFFLLKEAGVTPLISPTVPSTLKPTFAPVSTLLPTQTSATISAPLGVERSDIVGRWTYKSYPCVLGPLNVTGNGVFAFQADGTVTVGGKAGTWELDGNKITITLNVTYTGAVSGDTMSGVAEKYICWDAQKQ
jgi:serine/threonine protein kinase